MVIYDDGMVFSSLEEHPDFCFELPNASPSPPIHPPTAKPAVISSGKIYRSPFQTDKLFKSNKADGTSVFRNTINIIITTLLWSFGRLQENRKSLGSLIRVLEFQSWYLSNMFSISSLHCSLIRLLAHSPWCLSCFSSRWCQYCEREHRNCGCESLHHYEHHRPEDRWSGRRYVWTLLRGT